MPAAETDAQKPGMSAGFRLEEYKMLRTKAQDVTRRIEELERNVIVACSAIFVFAVSPPLAGHGWQRVILFVLPLCVSLVGFSRYRGLAKYMIEVNKYTMTVEKELGQGRGWLIHYYADPKTDDGFRAYREFIWKAVIGFNVVIGSFSTFALYIGWL